MWNQKLVIKAFYIGRILVCELVLLSSVILHSLCSESDMFLTAAKSEAVFVGIIMQAKLANSWPINANPPYFAIVVLEYNLHVRFRAAVIRILEYHVKN